MRYPWPLLGLSLLLLAGCTTAATAAVHRLYLPAVNVKAQLTGDGAPRPRSRRTARR